MRPNPTQGKAKGGGLSRTMTAIGMGKDEDAVNDGAKVSSLGDPGKFGLDDLVKQATGAKKLARKAEKKVRTDSIQVGIRCRPLIGRDAGQRRCFDTSGRSLTANTNAKIPEGKWKKESIPWNFDNVFDEKADVHQIHSAMTSEVTESVLEGYHGTIFAYGQTGSGKTYTMVGDRPNDVVGVMSLATEQIFDTIRADLQRQYMVRVSYLEIYNERVRDLLNPNTIKEELKVREDPATGFYVECTEVVVQSDDMIYEMLDAGNKCVRTVQTAHRTKP
jgi:hypothetical protein